MLGKYAWVFFYGLYMDFEILRERGLRVQQWEVAKLDGYEFHISSWGYLTRSDLSKKNELLCRLLTEAGFTPFAEQVHMAKILKVSSVASRAN